MHLTNKSKLVSKGFLNVEEAEIEYRDSKGKLHIFKRERLSREDAAAVFIYNKESGNVVLIRQFRFAVSDKVKDPIMEIIAGKISADEDPLETALREAIEECGYQIKKENIHFIASVFASPGYTSERFYLYYAEVSNEDRISKGGGLEEEHEFIEVIELPVKEFMELVDKGKIEDSKTLLTALWAKLRLKFF